VFSDEIKRLRVIGLIEGTSFLLLIGVAMPLKYVWGNPLGVKYLGWIQGLMFILYCVALAQAAAKNLWKPLHAALLFVAAILPGGPFVADGWLKKQQKR